MTMRDGSSGSYAFVTSTPSEAIAHSSSTGGGTSGTAYPSGYYNSTVKYDVTWEHPVSWGKLEKYFASIGDNNVKIAFSILEENAKSLEDHLDVAYLKTSGGTVYGTTNLAGNVNILGTLRIQDVPVTSLLPPPGSIMPYAGDIAPSGWLFCNGFEHSQTQYAGLYAVCGTKFNTSAGQSSPASENFRVPILTGRFPLGDNSLTALGDVGEVTFAAGNDEPGYIVVNYIIKT